MKGRAIIPLVVGLAVGVLAIKIFADVLRKARGAGSGESIAVVCAATDIGPTVEITESMVEVKATPKSLIPDLSFTKLEDVVGRVASLTIPRGMPVVPTLLAPKGTPPGMAVRIRDGYRAVAVKIDEFAGVAGWIKPASHVDVVAVMHTQGASRSQGTISKVILENVEVLAVGQDIGISGDTAASVTKSVTLLVRPEDVPKLHLAATKGTLRLAMRNQRDFSASTKLQTTDKDLLTSSSTGGSTKNRSGSGSPPSILSRLFHKQPKIAEDKTDKEPEGLRSARSDVVQSATPTQDQPWRVEVMTGPQTEEIWFDGDTRKARRLNGELAGGSPMRMDGRAGVTPYSHAIQAHSIPPRPGIAEPTELIE